MKKTLLLMAALLCAFTLSARGKKQAEEVLPGAVKLIDHFDEDMWDCTGNFEKSIDTQDFIQGTGSFRFDYSGSEDFYYQRIFENYRDDFSYFPYGISVWVKGAPKNTGSFKVVLLQGDMNRVGKGRKEVLQTFAYTDASVLKSKNWTKLVVKFEDFKPYEGDGRALDLTQVIGWRIEVVGAEGAGYFKLDKMEQMTTYTPSFKSGSRFSSIMVQLNNSYKGGYDFDAMIKAGLDVGIKEWICVFSIGRMKNGVAPAAFYTGSKLPFVDQKYNYDFVDKIMAAAEKYGVKVVLGPNYESWITKRIRDPKMYDEIYERCEMVIDEVYEKFGSSPAFSGWYIANEFNDGSKISWAEADVTPLIAGYYQKAAKHMKSLKDVPVCIAPALWRGYPAVMSAEFFDRFFQIANEVDILYLQDCAGRGPDWVTSVNIDLPNYFEKIKKSCEKNGVIFGVDIESFRWSRLVKPERRPKTWEELRPALEMAGNYTDHITMFSWYTFQPDQDGYKGYKQYVAHP